MKKLGIIFTLFTAAACSSAQPAAQAPTTAQWSEDAAKELEIASADSLKAWETGDAAAIEAGIAGDGFLTSYDLDMMGQPISFNSGAEVAAYAQKMKQGMEAMGATVSSKLTRVDCQATDTFGVCINEMECTLNLGTKIEIMHFRGTGTARKGEDGWKWTHWHGSLAKLPPPPAPVVVPASAPVPPQPVSVASKDLKWMTPPGAPAGLKVAPTWGDMMKGANAAYVEFPKNSKMPRHYHSANIWVHVLKGGMKVTFTDGKVVEVKAGDFGFVPAGAQHTTEVKDTTVVFQYQDGPESTVPVDDQGKPLPPPAAAPAATPAPAAAPVAPAAKAPTPAMAPAAAPKK